VPLCVLLDAPAEVPAVWHGWLLSAETDYAGWWDFVLQEQDAPFDPEAGMVQLWNPVRLYLPMAARVVGELSPARLQAVRTMAADFVERHRRAISLSGQGEWLREILQQACASQPAARLGNEHDARHRYQQLYFEAAEAIREPARLALHALAAIPVGQGRNAAQSPDCRRRQGRGDPASRATSCGGYERAEGTC
jgi:hypothetical protein